MNNNENPISVNVEDTLKVSFNSKNVHEPQLLFLGKVPIDNISPVSPINPEILKQKKEMEGIKTITLFTYSNK